jgi:hypothetical protein
VIALVGAEAEAVSPAATARIVAEALEATR